jgi:hypothetical protein
MMMRKTFMTGAQAMARQADARPSEAAGSASVIPRPGIEKIATPEEVSAAEDPMLEVENVRCLRRREGWARRPAWASAKWTSPSSSTQRGDLRDEGLQRHSLDRHEQVRRKEEVLELLAHPAIQATRAWTNAHRPGISAHLCTDDPRRLATPIPQVASRSLSWGPTPMSSFTAHRG